MDYIYGTVRRNGVTVENLKTVGETHTNLSGYVSTQRKYDDGTIITDRCRIVEHYQAAEAGGLCYDWYIIDNHNRYMDTSGALAEIQMVKAETENTVKLSGQMEVAAKLTIQESTTISDEDALKMPDLFKTWAEALAAKKQLAAETVLNKDGTLYRVVSAVTPQAHQEPGGEGMLAIYRPIDTSHAGTMEDPIPWIYGMDCETGLYYLHGGKLWLCGGDMKPCVWAPGTEGVWQWTEVTE